jgi:hypothetical protein
MLPPPKPIAERPAHRFPALKPTPEQEEPPTVWTFVKLVWNTVAQLFHEPVGMVMGSAFVVIMLWGCQGALPLLGMVWPSWRGPGSNPADRPVLIPGVPWDHEWISFALGAVLLVGIPIVLIKVVYKHDLSDYGLGLPRREHWPLVAISSAVLMGMSLLPFFLAAGNAEMKATYPLYRGCFDSLGSFAIYELGYLLFFIAIEFIFRERMGFGLYAILVSMLSYTAWHLCKPQPELWGTLVWGLVAGTAALSTRTIWHIVIVHWGLNVFLDYLLRC